MLVIESGRKLRTFEDEVAASVRDNFSKSVAHILDKLRESGVTQKAVAERLGWSSSMFSQIRSGTYNPTLEQVERIYETLREFSKGLEPEDLFREQALIEARDIEKILGELAESRGYKLIKKQ